MEKRLQKEEKKENDKEDKKDEKKEIKKDEKDEKKENKIIEKKDKYLSHIRLITSISKEKNQPKKIDYDDNIPKLYTYMSNLNKNKMNNISERINTSIDKKEDESTNKKRNNHSLYICDSYDKEKKYKKICKSRETNHLINESINNQINNYHNCSFRSINFSHSKSKKIKTLLNKKVIKNHLFHYFSSESKKKSNLTILELSEEKKNYHNNKTIERIISKTRNNKTTSVEKKNSNLKLSNSEKEKEEKT